MMRILAVLMFFSCAYANATGKLNFDFRTEYQATSPNDDAKSEGFIGNSRFYLKTARLDYANNLNEQTYFRARASFNKDMGAVSKRDSTNTNLIDLFYVSHQLTDFVNVTAGKFSSEMGGMENAYASPDLYFESLANAGVPTDTNTASATIWTGSGIVKYYTGIRFITKMDTHELAIHVADLSADDLSSSGKFQQNRLLTGLIYKGGFSEDLLKVMASYHEAYLPPVGLASGGSDTSSTDAKASYSALGVKLNIEQNILDLDYLVNLFKQRSAVTDDDSVKSLVIAWSKTFDQWTPRVKYEQSSASVVGQKIFDVTAYGLALEWKPKKDDNFRYHLAYNNKSYKPAVNTISNGNTGVVQEFIAGIKMNADFLK